MVITYSRRFRLDLVLFLAFISIPFGVNGLTLAAGLSDLFWKLAAMGLGLSMEKSLEHLYGTGVWITLFSIRVLGVAGESKSLRARTFLYGGLQAIDIFVGDPLSRSGIRISFEAERNKHVSIEIHIFLYYIENILNV